MSKNSFTELSEGFLELEKDLDLLNKKISGTYFWERVRFSVYMRLYKSVLDIDDSVDGSSNNIKGAWLLLRNLFVRNPFLSKETDLLFFGTGRRKQFEDGLWWDIYLDPVIESIDENSLMLERPYNVSHLNPAKTSNLRYVDVVEYTGTLLRKLGVSRVSFSEDEASLIKDTEREIASRFGVELSLESMVKKDLSERHVRLPLYRRLIRRVDPRIVILVNSYNGRESFVEACQREEVPVVELQHGVIGRYHMGYSFPYDKKNIFPDYFFSFGEFWSDSIDLPLPDKDVYPVGYPYLESESKKYENVKKKSQTLFISQPTIGEELSRFAVELRNHDNYTGDIVYKLHPNESESWETKYPWLADSDIRCVSGEAPLYRLFAESRAQIGVNSTALYEGLQFGLDTYVLEVPGYEYMDYLIENGHATLVRSVKEYIRYGNNDKPKGELDKTYFFESEPLANINSAIEEISR